VSSADCTSIPAASIASRTARGLRSDETWKTSPSRSTSSAPPSAAASVSSSSSAPSAPTSTTPRRSKSHATAPVVPRLPPCLENVCRRRRRCGSVVGQGLDETATPSGPYPS
jgi:hypothetical protein